MASHTPNPQAASTCPTKNAAPTRPRRRKKSIPGSPTGGYPSRCAALQSHGPRPSNLLPLRTKIPHHRNFDIQIRSRQGSCHPVLFRPSYGPLSPSAPAENLYSICTHPACAPGSRFPHIRPNASLRPPREPDGSFTKDVEVTTWDGWEEFNVGNSVVEEVALDLDERSGWRGSLETARRYWIRCDDVRLGMLGLNRYWRYGRKREVEPPVRTRSRDPKAVAVPLGWSNVVGFEVVEYSIDQICRSLAGSM